ncbi:YidC/Oxa1 family insertase periplasmic-domain containing protein [Flavobacteriales bacterium]|nr:YidC/Oxa1 family insertase periplasmic-domain containing protein [Flavobacteriales bacterium]
MEESKIDPYQIIGFLLLIACAFWVFYFNPNPSENIDKNIIQDESEISEPEIVDRSFIKNDDFKVKENEFITLENKDLKLVFSTKGAQISESVLKNYNKFDGDIIKINDNNQNFSFNSLNLNTSQVYFNYLINESSQGTEIKFFYSDQQGKSIIFNYYLPNQGFLLNVDVKISGYSQSIDRNSQIELNWSLDSYQNTKSEVYENRYTYLNYQDDSQDVRDLSAYSDDDDIDSAKWISYSQHLFNSLILFKSFSVS